jgi:hypothetical protein
MLPFRWRGAHARQWMGKGAPKTKRAAAKPPARSGAQYIRALPYVSNIVSNCCKIMNDFEILLLPGEKREPRHTPIFPPPRFVIATIEGFGGTPSLKSGQRVETLVKLAGLAFGSSSSGSPGC